jgi:streptogramin lyase
VKRRIAALLTVALLSGCGGGASSLPPTASHGSNASKGVKMTLVVPAAVSSSSSSAKRPAYISPAALGAQVSVTGAGGGSAQAVLDLSSSSTICSTSNGERSCAANVTAPLDNDTFVVAIYDTAPVNGVIPSSAHALGLAAVTQTITSTFTGTLVIAVGGVVSNIGLQSTFLSVPANGQPQSVGIAANPTDFGDNPIVTGSTSPYANPITAIVAEIGGSGHMSLVLNGTNVGTTATLKQSTDTLAVAYDGGGSAGYGGTIELAAANATAETFVLAPMYLTSTSPYYSGGALGLLGTPLGVPMTITEANAPLSNAYTATASSCTNIATVSAVNMGLSNPDGSVKIGTFSATGGTTGGAGCTVTVSDGITSIVVPTTNTPSQSGVGLAGESIAEYPLPWTSPPPSSAPSPSPESYAILAGPDGRLWYSDIDNGGVGAITASGSVTQYILPGDIYGALTVGSDGNIWGADANTVSVDKILTSNGALFAQYHTTYGPVGITNGPDGNVWFTESSGSSGKVGYVTPGGTVTEFGVYVDASPNPGGITTVGSNLWFCDDAALSGTVIDQVTTSGTITHVTATLPQPCNTLAVEPDGQYVWATTGFQGATSTGIMRINVSTGAVTQYALTGTSQYVTAGANGIMYVTEVTGSGAMIAQIPQSSPSSLTEIAVPTSGAVTRGVAAGPDGRIWFAEYNESKIGALSP